MSPAVEAPADLAPVFAALGDPTRLALIAKLLGGESRSISTLASDTALTRQAITKHLHVLEGAGLVEPRRVGRESRYVLKGAPIDAARAYLDGVADQWGAALERLQAFLQG